jgi:hypothetical protein
MKQILYKLFEHQYLGRDERAPFYRTSRKGNITMCKWPHSSPSF